MYRPGGELTQTAHTLRRAPVSLTTRMGCNLCTLQKREEHYKLLYEIAQVSGTLRKIMMMMMRKPFNSKGRMQMIVATSGFVKVGEICGQQK